MQLLPGLDVSRETLDKLSAFEDLVRKWSARINLVSRADIPDLRARHTLDSAQLVLHAPARRAAWLDLGSGGGFPGLVVAILAADAGIAGVTLVESDLRKATFLRTAIRELELPAVVAARRIEMLERTPHDVVSARALAPLPTLLDLAAPHVGPCGVALFPKGRSVETEIVEARRLWDFDLVRKPSITNPDAAILRVERISRV